MFNISSSLGFHTITLSLRLTYSDATMVVYDFKAYSKRTSQIQMYRIDETGKYIDYDPDDELMPLHIKITYLNYTGITWYINFYDKNNDYKIYNVEVTINPKFLGGVTDYLTAATWTDLNIAISNFNREAKSISPILKDFDYYNLIRLDYCVNFSLNELLPNSDIEQIITLLKRSHVPKHYKLYKIYDPKSHRKKTLPGSFYIYNNSITINCYSKYMQLLDLSETQVKNKKEPISEEILNKAKDIIRFEVQCHYPKAYSLSHNSSESSILYFHKFLALFTPKKCKEMIMYYYYNIIGSGDWYSLSNAIAKIKSENYNSQKERRLIETITLINQCRSVYEASKYYPDKNYDKFQNTLKELNQININPVTIPQNWGIKKIPNLLNAYFEKEAFDLANIESSPWK